MTVVVVQADVGETGQFAAAELSRYLARMLRTEVPVTSREPAPPTSVIELRINGRRPDMPEVDDEFTIDVRSGKGTISAPSGRSLLLGTYRFLAANGCRWVRPGPGGELVPSIASIADVVETQHPTHRYRLLAIEGSFSYKQLRDSIDWAPKAGFNGFFVQFRDAYTFFERWYVDSGPLGGRQRFPRGTAASLARRAEHEVLRRGLRLQTVGHGWTCESVGIPGLGWDYPPPEVLPKSLSLLALVDGERGLFGGVPINTNLCYSNPNARRGFVAEIVDYASRHPEVDDIHVWFADNANNYCECANCFQTLPADAYIEILNTVASAMSGRGLRQRIVCIAYQDLLWPPQVERIADPTRFIFAFAPVSRSYERPFKPADGAVVQMRPYRRNRVDLPRSADEHAAYLAAWRKVVPSDSFAFEYHLWRNQFTDLGSIRTARVLFDDLKALRGLGFQGFASCQPMRSSFPTGLAMCVLAETLWDDSVEFESVVAAYLEAAFGQSWPVARAYLETVSERLDPAYLRGEPVDTAAILQGARELPALAARARTHFAQLRTEADTPARRRSWEILEFHTWLVERLAAILRLRTTGKVVAGIAAWHDLEAELDVRAGAVDDALDLWMLKTSLASALSSPTEPPASWI